MPALLAKYQLITNAGGQTTAAPEVQSETDPVSVDVVARNSELSRYASVIPSGRNFCVESWEIAASAKIETTINTGRPKGKLHSEEKASICSRQS